MIGDYFNKEEMPRSLRNSFMMNGVSWLCFGVTTPQSHPNNIIPFDFRNVSQEWDIETLEAANATRH